MVNSIFKEHVNKELLILVFGGKVKLLQVAKFSCGNFANCAKAEQSKVLRDWGLHSKVSVLSFKTATSNRKVSSNSRCNRVYQ